MVFWIKFFRSLFAVTLGVVLLIQPDKTGPFLTNFIGFYWISSGLLSIRWGVSREGANRVTIIAGVIGALAGLGLVTRHLTEIWVRRDIIVNLLGATMLLTGILHMTGSLKVNQLWADHRSRAGVLLGVFEIILALSIIVSPLDRSPITYLAASIWALLGGFILLGDAVYVRQQAGQAKTKAVVEDETHNITEQTKS